MKDYVAVQEDGCWVCREFGMFISGRLKKLCVSLYGEYEGVYQHQLLHTQIHRAFNESTELNVWFTRNQIVFGKKPIRYIEHLNVYVTNKIESVRLIHVSM